MMAIFLTFLICFCAAVQTEAEIAEKVVAVVNDEVITLTELNGIVRPIVFDNKSKFEGEEGKKKLKELKSDILKQMIEEKLISQEAKARNIEITKGEIENRLKDTKARFPSESEFEIALKNQGMTLDKLKERIKENLLAKRLIDQEVMTKVLIDDKEIEEFYKKHMEEFKEPDKIRVSHILIKSKGDEQESLKKINDISVKLHSGASFSELAKKFSEDESSRENSGNLGIIKRGDMVPEFEAAAFSLKEGNFSDVVKTPLGYHIIKVDAIIPGRYYSITDEIEVPDPVGGKRGTAKEKTSLKELIKYELLSEKTKSKLDNFVNGLKEKAVIEINL